MSALHRLKAYFGMVPAEDLDAAGLDPGELNTGGLNTGGWATAQLDNYGPPYRSGYPDQGGGALAAPTSRKGDYAAERSGVRCSHWAGSDDYGDSFATRTGRHAPPTMHSAGSQAWVPASARATEVRVAEPHTDSWATETPIRGSLAIDTSPITTKSTAHQPATPPRVAPVSRTGQLADDGAATPTRIVTLHPSSYNEARPIGERYREGNPVIMNLTAMEDRDAKRLVDFAAGLAFALRGSIDKITNKVFLLSPSNVDVSDEDRRRIAEGHLFN